jgi:CBS domain-containing protein
MGTSRSGKTRVQEILERKGFDVWSVSPETTVFDALQLMAEKRVGALLVMESGRVVGIFSERDYARRMVLAGISSKETPVKEIMINRVAYVRQSNTVEDCMALMTDKHVRHLPVFDEGRLVGLVSIGDAVQAMISEKSYRIEELENFIKLPPPKGTNLSS